MRQNACLITAVDRELDYWETYAEKTVFIAEDEFGLAGCAFLPILAYMVHLRFEWCCQADPGFNNMWPIRRPITEDLLPKSMVRRGEREGVPEISTWLGPGRGPKEMQEAFINRRGAVITLSLFLLKEYVGEYAQSTSWRCVPPYPFAPVSGFKASLTYMYDMIEFISFSIFLFGRRPEIF